ncbi:hypothetical protein [Gracilibacillus massiliensis]|uniref:hypothetical protein n=1 Tax=Gracilibacillus massiliensis TaxID=1564956 RepID=UPI00071E49BD|nr:hypothetical protein [Gracilibacillus massiliensis]
MNHVKKSCLKKYVSRELDVDQQEIIENHLYECERCMDAYFELLENQSISTILSEDFTNQVVTKANKQLPKSNPRQFSPKKAIAHYFLAAGLTVVLMLTGIFQGVLDVSTDHPLENKLSITEQALQQANQLLDHIKGEVNQ